MRHIPEDELHAYLDQALSRSQCIEIETHLSRCGACADLRDAIAALRDRTTALLDRVAPPLAPRRPPYEVLLGRAVVRRQRPLRRYGLWAASLAGAVVAGWGLRALVTRAVPEPVAGVEQAATRSAEPQELALAPTETASAAVQPDPLPPLAPDPARFTDAEVRLAGRGPSAPAAEPTLPVSTGVEAGRALLLDAGWILVSLPEAEEATGHLVPVLPELPVTEIRLRRAAAQERPLLVITQRHPTAGLLHTVEGPVSDVAALVAAQLRPDLDLASSEPSRSLPDYVEAADGIRRTSRVLVVVDRLPADSLNALAQAVVMR